MSKTKFRVGLIVPSSNVTMETEIPAMLRARETIEPERFTFHSSRMRMKSVTKEELEKMDDESDRCAVELSDAAVDVMGYACLVAIMTRGAGYHCVSQERLSKRTIDNGHAAPVEAAGSAVLVKPTGSEQTVSAAWRGTAHSANGNTAVNAVSTHGDKVARSA